MEPIIYTLPKTDKKFDLAKKDIVFDSQPSPKLIKYGFNNINNQFDLVSLSAVPHYRAGLNFDLERKDENSISVKISQLLKVKNVDQNFAEFWEILNLFGMLETNQNIYTTHLEVIKNIVDVYQKISGTKNNFSVLGKIDSNSKGKASLIIHKYSDIDIDENAAVQFITNNLTNLLESQSKGASMVLQLFNLQTQITAELMYYLSTLYEEAYLIKPTVSSDLSDNKFLVLLGLKSVSTFPTISRPEKLYLVSIGLQHNLSELDTVVQCMISDLIPKKYKKYNQIKEYLDTKVYEGATYQELMQTQDKNTTQWLETFIDLTKMKKLLDSSIQKSSNKCSTYSQLIGLLN